MVTIQPQFPVQLRPDTHRQAHSLHASHRPDDAIQLACLAGEGFELGQFCPQPGRVEDVGCVQGQDDGCFRRGDDLA